MNRTKLVAQHMSTASGIAEVEEVLLFLIAQDSRLIVLITQPPLRFESNRALRTYILNRPRKYNALNETMLNMLRPKIEVKILEPL